MRSSLPDTIKVPGQNRSWSFSGEMYRYTCLHRISGKNSNPRPVSGFRGSHAPAQGQPQILGLVIGEDSGVDGRERAKRKVKECSNL